MRSILNFIRAVLSAATSVVYVFVREGGRLVGKWVRALQPTMPTQEPARSLEQLIQGDAPTTVLAKRHQGDEHVYAALAEVAASLAAGQAPRPAAAQLLSGDAQNWLELLTQTELGLVGHLSPSTLKAHLTGRVPVPALLRMSKAEMLERQEQQEQLSERRLAIGNQFDAALASTM